MWGLEKLDMRGIQEATFIGGSSFIYSTDAIQDLVVAHVPSSSKQGTMRIHQKKGHQAQS